jgi:Leucine-rich repeat (LRR) protein
VTFNRISDAGAAELAKLAGLTTLDVRNNNIGDAGAAELAKLTGLTTLDASYNNIGDAGAADLTKLSLMTLNVRRSSGIIRGIIQMPIHAYPRLSKLI